tara:strand:- start:97885 stop:99807 length:1923 start_codon:yes stop_codon:yes gene_type:complete
MDGEQAQSIAARGIYPGTQADLLPASEATKGVVRVMSGSNHIATGTFLSDRGLFISNYFLALSELSAKSNPDNYLFEKGFSANSISEELSLGNLSLWIEIEQKDVTEEIKQHIPPGSSNYEIYQVIQAQKQRLMQERKADNNDIVVEIKDLFGGNQHQMNVYKIIRDVRLVFAPPVAINQENAANSTALAAQADSEYALLRAYVSPEGYAMPYDKVNIPFTPRYHFNLSSTTNYTSTDTLFAMGFPQQSYRLESEHALRFYNQHTNPYILSSYKINAMNQDSLAGLNESAGIKTIAPRYFFAKNVEYYQLVQQGFADEDILTRKNSIEEQLIDYNLIDSAEVKENEFMLWHIDQAFDIAESTGDIFYATAYFLNFSRLDELANIFAPYFKALEEGSSEQEIGLLREELISHQQQVLSTLSIGPEVYVLKEFLKLITTVPDFQQPLLFYDLFFGLEGDALDEAVEDFAQQKVATSFLFMPARTDAFLKQGDPYGDDFYALLSELTETYETARSTFVKYFVYLFPAQQTYVSAMQDHPDLFNLFPDSDGSLRFSIGSIDPAKQTTPDFFFTKHDFPGRAPGTVILNSNGEILGITTDELFDNVLNNYLYDAEHAYLKVRSVHSVLNDLRNSEANSVLQELSN